MARIGVMASGHSVPYLWTVCTGLSTVSHEDVLFKLKFSVVHTGRDASVTRAKLTSIDAKRLLLDRVAELIRIGPRETGCPDYEEMVQVYRELRAECSGHAPGEQTRQRAPVLEPA